jgi:hypothetical protein
MCREIRKPYLKENMVAITYQIEHINKDMQVGGWRHGTSCHRQSFSEDLGPCAPNGGIQAENMGVEGVY